MKNPKDWAYRRLYDHMVGDLLLWAAVYLFGDYQVVTHGAGTKIESTLIYQDEIIGTYEGTVQAQTAALEHREKVN